MKSLQEFKDQFKFNPEKNLFIGVERECHLLDPDGNISPMAQKVLRRLASNNGQFTYELSACQFEWRIGPCRKSHFGKYIRESESFLKDAEKRIGFKRSFFELAPEGMPLDIYPDPTGRYQEITKYMPINVLSAACRVIATHIHIGMPNHEIALKVYNKAISRLDELCSLGDHSDGRRLEIYKVMAPNWIPPYYETWADFYNKAIAENFVDSPRSCWTLIRMSKHGTIEFRMFGSTSNLSEIEKWVNICYKICS